jgi:ubiquinone/menaquinone biosynthesis C-methylase UbiE
MAIYAKYVLPRLIDLEMRNKDATRLRAIWIPQARGNVLELGIGYGLNLPYCSPEVQHIYGADPSSELPGIAQHRVKPGSPAIEFLCQSAEEPLPLADSCADTVVLTWASCSISNVSRELEEMKRVLRTDGRLIFVEHGRAPDASVSAWQDRLTPLLEDCHRGMSS